MDEPNTHLFRKAIEDLFDRFHRSSLTEADFIQIDSVNAHVNIGAVDVWLTSKAVMEQDVLPFRHLDNPDEVILDVGAHLGYTAASFRSLPVRNFIHSFEPTEIYNPMLDRLTQLDDKYSYSNVAISDGTSQHQAYNLVINGNLVGGTASIGGKTFETWLSDYLITRLGENWLPRANAYEAKFVKLEFSAQRLDDIVFDQTWKHFGRRISGLKIDVEGHEREVLAGSARVLREHRPLVMVEVTPGTARQGLQQRNPLARLAARLLDRVHRRQRHQEDSHNSMVSRMKELQYAPFERDGDVLRPLITPHYNAYFVHEQQVGDCAKIGLITK